MSLIARWRGLLGAGALQALGSAATFGSTIVLAHARGPEIQGGFSLVKAEIDFLTALLLVGMPQAVFYFCRRGKFSVGQAARLAIYQGGVALVAVIIWRLLIPPRFEFDLAAMLVAAATSAAVCYGTVRGALLSTSTTWQFALFSATPPMMILAFVALSLLSGQIWVTSPAAIAAMFLAAYFVSASIGFRRIGASPRTEVGSIDRRMVMALTGYGAATWLSVAIQSGTVYLLLRWVQGGANQAEAGALAAGFALVSIAVTPVNLVAPLLFKQWTEARGEAVSQAFREASLFLMAAAAAFAFVVWALGRYGVTLLFGSEYIPYLLVFAVLSLTAGPQCFAKIGGVLYSSIGKPMLSVAVDATRLLVVVGGMAIFGPGLTGVAVIWVVGEYVALGVGIYTALRITKRMSMAAAGNEGH